MSVSVRAGNARLLKLADFLKTVPPDRFDLRVWAGGEWEGKADLSCGTSACAMGWATTMPAFRRLGLRLEKYISPAGLEWVRIGMPSGNRNFVAVAELFGIDYAEACRLFSSDNYPTGFVSPQQVARRIREFVRERGEE